MNRPIAGTAAALFVLGALGPHPAGAQDLRYDLKTGIELGGTTGRFLSALPGGGGPTVESTFLKGNRIRRDEGDGASTIMNWETGILTTLDHEARTFVEVNLAEMAEAAAQVAEEAARSLDGQLGDIADAAAEGAETAAVETEEEFREEGGDQLGLEVVVQSDRTGRMESFGAYTAEQILVTLEIKAEKDYADWDAEDDRGGLAIVSELWLSQDFPEYQMMREMQGEALERLEENRTDEGLLGALEALLAYDPRIKFAFEKNKETIDAMDGVALRTTLHFVNLPEDARLDRDQVLAEADRSLMDDASDAAQEGVRDAAKSAVSGLTRGLFGRKKEPEPEPEPEVEMPQQSVFIRITSEVENVSTAELDEGLFVPPADYRALQASAGNGPS